MDNEQEQFLKELGIEENGNDVLTQPLTGEEPTEEIPAEDETKLRNRRERRLADKLQAEREASIVLAARLEAITEAQKFRQDTGETDPLKSLEKIYGTDTPEGREATEVLKAALKGVGESAKASALEEFRAQQTQVQQEVSDNEDELESMVEELEDENNIDLTSAQADVHRKGFFRLLEKMSPKDREGNIIYYADHHAVWDAYSQAQKRVANPARDLASRSMTQSGSSKENALTNDATTRYLSDNGFI